MPDPAGGHDVAIDFTRPDAVRANVERCLAAGVPTVVGTTGLADDDVGALDELARTKGVPCLVVPNFALGAVLMMRFAAQASRHRPRGDRRAAPRAEARRALGHGQGDRGRDGGRRRDPQRPPAGARRAPGGAARRRGQTLTIRRHRLAGAFVPGVLLALDRLDGSRPASRAASAPC